MMKKGLVTAAVAGMMAAAMVMPAFAAEWKQDSVGWWYQQDDGGYPAGEWSWIDGRCYYFDETGYCLLDTTTPDGYTVDASGAWTVDGVVQTQEGEAAEAAAEAAPESFAIGALTVTTPVGFAKIDELTMQNCIYFANGNLDGIIGVAMQDIPDMNGYESLLDSMSEGIIDLAMSQLGTVETKSAREFTSGTWYCYRFANAADMGIDGQLYVNARIRNADVEMVLFMGNLVGIDMDGIMNNNIR